MVHCRDQSSREVSACELTNRAPISWSRLVIPEVLCSTIFQLSNLSSFFRAFAVACDDHLLRTKTRNKRTTCHILHFTSRNRNWKADCSQLSYGLSETHLCMERTVSLSITFSWSFGEYYRSALASRTSFNRRLSTRASTPIVPCPWISVRRVASFRVQKHPGDSCAHANRLLFWEEREIRTFLSKPFICPWAFRYFEARSRWKIWQGLHLLDAGIRLACGDHGYRSSNLIFECEIISRIS